MPIKPDSPTTADFGKTQLEWWRRVIVTPWREIEKEKPGFPDAYTLNGREILKDHVSEDYGPLDSADSQLGIACRHDRLRGTVLWRSLEVRTLEK